MADNTQINDFFDLAAFAEQARIVVDESAKTAEKMRAQFSEVAKGLNADGLNQYAAAAEKLQKTQRAAKQVLSDYEKAQERLTKSQGDYNRDLERLDELLQAEAKSTAAMAAQNKALEQIRKNLNTTDKNYAATVQRIIDKQNANIKVMKEFQNVEQKRTSGIGKYKEAIEAAMKSTGGYRAQLMNIRNTMAEVEQAIIAAKEAHGEESEEVRTLQTEYDKLQKKAGQLQDAQNDMQARIKYLADDYGKLKAVLQGMQAAMGIVSVFQGATAVLGIHSQAVEKTTKNMAALIAMMQGLKQVQELLNKDNYFMQFLKQSPALSGAVGKVTGAFKKLFAVVKSFGGYLAIFAAALAATIKLMKVLRTNEFYEFNKTLSKTTDASERLALSQEFLQKQFGNTTLKVGDLNEKLKDTKKGFNDIVKAIAETALADAMSTKLKELADKAVELAAYEAQARKRLAELRNQEAKELKEYERQAKYLTTGGIGGTPVSSAGGVAGGLFAAKQPLNKVRDEIKAITDALKEQRKGFQDFAAEYKDLASVSSEELTKSLGSLLKGIDLSGLLAQEATAGAEATKNETAAVGQLGRAVEEINEVVTKLATKTQYQALARTQEYTRAVADLQREFLAGKITLEEYEEQLANLTFRNQQEELRAAIDALKEQNEVLDANSEEYVRNATEIAKLEKQLNDLNFAKFSEKFKKSGETSKEVGKNVRTFYEQQFDLMTAAAKKGQEKMKEIAETTQNVINAVREIANEAIGNFSEISGAIFESQQGRLAREEAEMAEHYELQRAYIEANVHDEEERSRQLQQLALDEANAKAIAARKEAEVERKKAKVDLAITAAKASADIAAAIAAAVLTASTGGEGYTVALRIAAAISAVLSGAAAVASAAAKIGNIPAFEKGGEAKRGLIFRAGERGYEVGEGVSGRSYFFPKDGVYMAPEPMRIHPHGESVQMVNNYNKAVTLRNSLTVKVIDNKRIEKYFGI